MFVAKSFIESGNRTRGQFGGIPKLERVSFDYEMNKWKSDEAGSAWGAWDIDFGWIAPWPENDVEEVR